ncbi:MAG: methyltransferase domain-containing protein, partial [Vicinamibacterales bacterium]
DLDAVRRFYDRNTAAFVALGQGGAVGAIHRAVWGPGVTNAAEAFRYVEDAIVATLRSTGIVPVGAGPAPAPARPHVLDLGCGVGASLCYLAERLPITGTGVTLSPVQARVAGERIAAGGLTDRVQVIEGSYTNLPASIGMADAAYAIESFVHGPDPARFFAEAARVIRPGGILAICDDIARPTGDQTAQRTLGRFRRGWHVHSLVTAPELQQRAGSAGFAHISTVDLTPWLQLGRPRDVVIDLLLPLVAWLPLEHTRLGHLDGGRALQRALKRGWLGYDLTVFRRNAGPAS